ncbi:zinc finger, CCHC-type containing protein, partial [Tanacetum coccineum]
MAVAAMSVVYVLNTPIPEDGENATVDQIKRRNKWDNDDYVCRGLILKGMSDILFDIYLNVESGKELWDSLEAKYMIDDASSKKFLVSNFTNYKMTDSKPVMEQYNELLGILGRFTQHKMNMDEAIQEELTLVELDSHLRIEESLRAQDSDKPKGNNVVCSQTDRGGEYMDTLYFLSVGIIHETTVPIPHNKMVYLKGKIREVVRLPDPNLETFGERGIECIFVGYAKHSKAFRFYVIEPNESVLINSIIELRDAIFDDNRFTSVPRPSLRIPKGTEDIGDSVVPQKVTKEGTRDEVSDQHSYCFNVEDDSKTFDEAMNSQDVALWKEVINDEMDFIMGNKTWVLADLPPCCKPLVARISTIRLLIAMASIHNLIIHQMDVKTVFLNGELNEEVYMNQPQGFIMPGNENK